jgi:hypothetical protein
MRTGLRPVPRSRSTRQFTWDRRIFEDRSQALAYVCEAPVILEQRLFEIAQRIQAKL